MITLHFTCGERKICSTNKKSQNIMSTIVVEKYDEDIDGNEMVYNKTLFNSELDRRACKSCTLYVILLIIAFIIIMGISSACFYLYRRMKRNYFKALSYYQDGFMVF